MQWNNGSALSILVLALEVLLLTEKHLAACLHFLAGLFNLWALSAMCATCVPVADGELAPALHPGEPSSACVRRARGERSLQVRPGVSAHHQVPGQLPGSLPSW